MEWYLVCHKTGKDNLFKAQAALERISVNSFSPLIRTLKERADTRAKRLSIEPLFPGYFFIEFDVESCEISKIKSTPGFSHFVQFGSQIKPISYSIVDELMSLPMCLLDEPFKKAKNSRILSKRNRELIEKIAQNEDKLSRTSMFIAFIESIKD